MKVLPHVFGAGPSICNATWIQRYAHRMCLPCGFTVMGDLSWNPSMGLEGNLPLLWLRADQGLSTGGARQFYSADKTSMRHADNAFFSTGDIDFLWAGWVYLDSLSGDNYIFAKGGPGEYQLRTSGTQIEFLVYCSPSSPTAVITGLSASKWYFFLAWHDSVANTVNLSINNGTASSVSTGGISPVDSADEFVIGGRGVYPAYMTGRISRPSFLKNTAARAVIDSAATQTAMYNLGRGILSGNLDLLLADLGTFTAGVDWDAWNLNETDGTASARSFSGLNDLTPTFGELITNGGFETAGAGGADVFGSWNESALGTSAISRDTVAFDAGAASCKFTMDASGSQCVLDQTLGTVGHRYTSSVRAIVDSTSGTPTFEVLHGGDIQILTPTTSWATYATTATATAFSGVYIRSSGSPVVNNADRVFNFDTFSYKAVDIPAADGPSSDIAPDTGSVGTNHGQLIGFADSETARSTDVPSAIGAGTSLSFDGVDDYVTGSASGLPSGSADRTISLWVKFTSVTGGPKFAFAYGTSVATTDLFAIGRDADKVYFSTATVGIAGPTSISADTWYHLVCTYSSGTTMAMYLNGVLEKTQAVTVSTGTTRFTIGSIIDASLFGDCKVDDVQVFESALSLLQIGQLYANTAATGATPVSMWTFDEETSLSITDGDPIAVWQSLEGSRHQFIQATASKRPVYRASAINSQAGIDFDGVDDLLVKASAFLTGTSGTVVVVGRLDSVPNTYQVVLGSSDEAGLLNYTLMLIRGNTANPHIGITQRNNDTQDLLDGSSTVSVDTDYAATFGSTGTTTNARLNSVAQTLVADSGANNGDWWDDTTGKDNVTLGAWKASAEASWMSGKICEVIVYPHNFGAESISKVAAYILARYGITF